MKKTKQKNTHNNCPIVHNGTRHYRKIINDGWFDALRHEAELLLPHGSLFINRTCFIPLGL